MKNKINTVVTVQGTKATPKKSEVTLDAPKVKKAPTYSNDKLIKLGIAETLKACEGFTGQQASKMATIIFYNDKAVKTPQECKFLANALLFFDVKSISKIYNVITKSKNPEINEALKGVLGKSKVPTFAEFIEVAKEGKQFFSVWDGLGMMAKFNNSAKQLKRAERQNKAQAKK